MADLGANGVIVRTINSSVVDLTLVTINNVDDARVGHFYTIPENTGLTNLGFDTPAVMTGIPDDQLSLSAVMDSSVQLVGSPDAFGIRRVNVGESTSYIVGMGKSESEGNPAGPSLKIPHVGCFRFRLAIPSGHHRVFVNVKQASNAQPRPSLVMRECAEIGVMEDIVAYAPSGTGWVTISLLFEAAWPDGALLEIWNNQAGADDPLYVDHVVYTAEGASLHPEDVVCSAQAHSENEVQAPMLLEVTLGLNDAATTAWLAEVAAVGGSVNETTIGIVDTFVKACKAGGFWDKILDCGIFVGNNLTTARVKLKQYTGSPASLTTFVSTPENTYSEATGYAPSGSYPLHTGFGIYSISSNGVNMHMSMYARQGLSGRGMGSARANIATRHYMIRDTLGGGWDWGSIKSFSGSSTGFNLAQRRAAENAYRYLNGVSQDNFNPDGSAPAKVYFCIGAATWSLDGEFVASPDYNGVVPGGYSIQFYSLGTAFTNEEITTFNNAVTAMQTSLGRA